MRFLSLIIFFLISACSNYHPQTAVTPKPVSSVNTTSHANAELALKYLHQGYTDKAQEVIRTSLAKNPNDPLMLDVAAWYYEKTGSLDIADQYYRRAILVAPYSGDAKNNYGAFLCRNGNYEKSILYFIKAYKTPGYQKREQAKVNAYYCTNEIEHSLGDHATYAYYTRVLQGEFK